MLAPFIFLAGFLTIFTAPGLIALHFEDRRKAKKGLRT